MYHRIISVIKLNLMLKNKIIKIKLIGKDFVILNILLKLNIVYGVKKYKNNLYFIKLNLNSMFYSIKNLYKSSKPITISLKEIIKINRKRGNLFYLSTNKGLINNFEAENNKVGGVLIMNVWI